MSTFSYKATDSSGKIVSGSLEALDEKDAVTRLQGMGYIPMKIGHVGTGANWFSTILTKNAFSFLSGVSTKDVVIFSQDLSSLLGAGLPVDRALQILIGVVEKEKFKEIIQDILKTVQGGGYLSDALAKHPRIFSTFYINMVKAGESGGVLDLVLERLCIFLESSQELKDYIKSAMVYPLFLVMVGGVSIIILLTFVLPKFSIIFSDMGQTIPASTRFLLSLSGILKAYWWVIIGVFAGIFFLFRRYKNSQAGRLKYDEYKMNLPVVGEMVKKIEVSRFARTLGTLTKSGVPILQALHLVKDIIGNRVISQAMGKTYDRVKEGERLSKPLRESGVFPSMAIQMITVGEETGRLDEMLLRVADNYEKIVRDMVKRLISLLEPAMILCMGLVVGFVVISMLMAIFSMNEIPF